MRPLILCLFATLVMTHGARACSVPTDAAQLASLLLLHINQERARSGEIALRMSPELLKAAQEHACDNANHNRLSHTGNDGSTFRERILRMGYDYRFAAENVAIGYQSPELVLAAWLASPEHKRNIYERRPTELGIGVARGRDGRMHWVMNAATR